MTALRDRPAIHLRRLMVDFGAEFELVDANGLPKAISGRAVGLCAWPDIEPGISKGRVESMLAGRQTRPEHVEAIAAFFGVDAGLFYQEPDAALDALAELVAAETFSAHVQALGGDGDAWASWVTEITSTTCTTPDSARALARDLIVTGGLVEPPTRAGNIPGRERLG